MKSYLPRMLEQVILQTIGKYPVTAIIGPRQCGKTSVARHICSAADNYTYLDLENETDLERITDNIKARAFLKENMAGLIILDEIHLRQDIFRILKGLADEIAHSRDKNFSITHPARFVVLGSASPILLKQTAESLTGRIAYERLTTLLISEIPNLDMREYIVRGGFPPSYLAVNQLDSIAWRKLYAYNFLNSDLLQWGNFSIDTMAILWETLVSLNGQETNFEKIINSLGVHREDVQAYVGLLKELYLVDRIQPYSTNLYSRLRRTPRTYVADSGIALASLGISSFDALTSPQNATTYGTIWESIVLAHLRAWYPSILNDNIYIYRDKQQNEIDFILCEKQQLFAIECKTSPGAHMSSGTYRAMEELRIPEEHAFVVAPFVHLAAGRAITLFELHSTLDSMLQSLP